MPYTHYDRLTALDTTFLELESPGVHMHVGSIGVMDPGPLSDESGGLDFDRVQTVVEAGLSRAPRFRQKLATTPVTGHPVWIDDEHFNLLYHVRHTALPFPGDERRLKRLAGRIMSEKLDRSKPMWELWFVEGLEQGRCAVISKVHHCLIDGHLGRGAAEPRSWASTRTPRIGRSRTESRLDPAGRPRAAGRMLVRDEIARPRGVARSPGCVRRRRRAGSGALGDRIEQTPPTRASGFVETLSAKALKPGVPRLRFNVPIGPLPALRLDALRPGRRASEIRQKQAGRHDQRRGPRNCVAGAVRRLPGPLTTSSLWKRSTSAPSCR